MSSSGDLYQDMMASMAPQQQSDLSMESIQQMTAPGPGNASADATEPPYQLRNHRDNSPQSMQVQAQLLPSAAMPANSRYFAKHQTDAMETMYGRNNTPDKDAMEILARSIGLSYDQVRKWMSRRKGRKGGASKPAPMGSYGYAVPQQVQALQNEDQLIRESSPSDESVSAVDSPTSAPIQSPPPQESAFESPAVEAPPAATAPPGVTLQDIDFEDPSNVTKYLKFLAASSSTSERCARLNLDGLDVSAEFYEGLARSKSFKGLILLRQWISEAKDGGQTDLLREVLQLLFKLPINLDGLVASKIGRVLGSLLQNEGLQEDVKQLATGLRTSWAKLVQESNPAVPAIPAAPATSADKLRMKREAEEAAAAAAAREAQEISAKLIASLPKLKRVEKSSLESSSSLASASDSTESPKEGGNGEQKFPSFSYRKAKSASSPEEEKFPTDTDTVMDDTHDSSPGGVRSILSSTITPDVDPANPRKKRKSVKFALDLVKTRYFNIDDDASMVGDRNQDFKNKSARESEKQEGRMAFRKELKEAISWRAPRAMQMTVYPSPTSTPETENQDERERMIIAKTFYDIADIPADPEEPDPDYGEDDLMDAGEQRNVTTYIPLDDPEAPPPPPPAFAPPISMETALGGFTGLAGLLQQQQQPPAQGIQGLSGLSGLAGLNNLGLGIGSGTTGASAPSPLALLLAMQQNQNASAAAPQAAGVAGILKSLGVAGSGGVPGLGASGIQGLSFMNQQQQQSTQSNPLLNILQGGGLNPYQNTYGGQQQQQQQPNNLLGLLQQQQQANQYSNGSLGANTGKHGRNDGDDEDEEHRRKRFADSGDFSRSAQGGSNDRSDQSGRGAGRGRGRGEIKPRGRCHFWSIGQCQYGDKCFNIHEGAGGSKNKF
ncbi:hypothetical protein HDU77_004802 [Chytriomyces hyalinus]|nr:hypothetical protein HDU77_004802 [Chytriomyces hyalinus]